MAYQRLKKSKATWKIVAYHHPAFNTSKVHYNDQQMRLLSPILEAQKVDLVLAGHVHNYQRSAPLKFLPAPAPDGGKSGISREGRVNGTFTIDRKFDGITHTVPKGIIYIVTGAGGAPLYDKELTNEPGLWKQASSDNWAPFTVKLISDTHSFTLIETSSGKLTFKQLDDRGELLDQFILEKR